jgi:putative membrane protein
MAQSPHSAPALDTSTELAFARTRAAYERTMMSWIRTATSLITFGFSIYKFFQIEKPLEVHQDRLIGAREFAFLLVSIGLISLMLATVEHSHNIRALRAQCPDEHRSLAVLLAALILVLGILALVAITYRQ